MVTQKCYFFVGFPPLAQEFFVNSYEPLNARVSSYSDIKLHNVSPFGLKIRKKKGQIKSWLGKTHCVETKTKLLFNICILKIKCYYLSISGIQ